MRQIILREGDHAIVCRLTGTKLSTDKDDSKPFQAALAAVSPVGLEPTTSELKVRSSSQLSYEDIQLRNDKTGCRAQRAPGNLNFFWEEVSTLASSHAYSSLVSSSGGCSPLPLLGDSSRRSWAIKSMTS